MNADSVVDAKFAFVVAEQPPYVPGGGNQQQRDWQDFSITVQREGRPPERMKMMGANVWLLALADGLLFLAQLIKWGEQYRIPLRILFLAKEPDWIMHPPERK